MIDAPKSLNLLLSQLYINYANILVSCLVLASQVPDDVDGVHVDVLIVEIAVPLPQSVCAVLESQDTVTVRWLAEG